MVPSVLGCFTLRLVMMCDVMDPTKVMGPGNTQRCVAMETVGVQGLHI